MSPRLTSPRAECEQSSRGVYAFSLQHHLAYRRADADRPLVKAFVEAFLHREQ